MPGGGRRKKEKKGGDRGEKKSIKKACDGMTIIIIRLVTNQL